MRKETTRPCPRAARRRVWAAAIECIGIAVTGVGIGCELALGGELHLVVITVGSCPISVGGWSGRR